MRLSGQTERLQRDTHEYVFVAPAGPDDLSNLVHDISITREGDDERNWVTATWDADEAAVRVLVQGVNASASGADFTLEPGRWAVHWRVHANPEEPVRRAGTIVVL